MKKAGKPRPPKRSSDLHCRVAVRRERNLPRGPSNAVIRAAVRRVLSDRGCRGVCSLSVLLAGERSVAALNARFRGVPRPTDVLSFPARVTDPADGGTHLGDIVLSLPRAAAQARTRRRTLRDEALLLIVHGTLHLLGFDHDTAARRKRMWRAQRQSLRKPSAGAQRRTQHQGG
jgi:probable rRNA maturation factor